VGDDLVTSVISRVPAVLSYLADTFTAAPTLGQAVPPVRVYDGPAVTAEPATLILWVGLDDPDSDAAPLAATSERAWAGLGGQQEAIVVYCAAEAWSGTDDIRPVRTAAYQIVAAVETLVRADATGFGGNGLTADPGVTASELRQNDTDRGAQARVVFSIILRAL
jgi:hypothetical protein